MSLARVYSRAAVGVDAPAVTVEVHVGGGLPRVSMVGLPQTAVRESKDRVKAALLNAGFDFPDGAVTISLAPADLPKEGSRFDLPIALGMVQQAVEQGRFREDLLFRLNTVEITIPPLRERRDDILPIARHYAAVYAKKYGKAARAFSAPAEAALLDYDWPGNVRALRHAVERAVILTSGERIEPPDLQLDYPGEAASPTAQAAGDLHDPY